jgi:hypothetical protein
MLRVQTAVRTRHSQSGSYFERSITHCSSARITPSIPQLGAPRLSPVCRSSTTIWARLYNGGNVFMAPERSTSLRDMSTQR